MGMKKKTGIREQSIPDKNQLSEANHNEAGNPFANAIGSTKGIEWESRDIALSDIRTNEDNAIFRELDDEDDIRRLAEDIKRNGLLHNLVVFPEQHGKETVYVLLSGERRYKALSYLDKQGDANWNKVKNCHVITSKLTDNEKKVLLYSANLQVRGGFGDEQIRRKAGTEFIACLKKEPYNLSKEEATKALKEISSVSDKQIDRDRNIEDKLNDNLKKLLNAHFVTRPQSEIFLKFEAPQQEKIAERLLALSEVNCLSRDSASQVRQERKRDEIQGDMIKEIAAAQRLQDPDERDKKLAEAFAECEESIEKLKAEIAENNAAAIAGDSEKLEDLEKQDMLRREEKRAAEKNSTNDKESFVEKSLPSVIDKMTKKMGSPSYQKGIRRRTAESRKKDIEILNQLIEKAQSLKAMIEAAE